MSKIARILAEEGLIKTAGGSKPVTASGAITMWTSDMSADYIVGGEYKDFTFARVTVEKVEAELLKAAKQVAGSIWVRLGGSAQVGRVMFLGTNKGFKYAVRIRVTGMPMGAVVQEIESVARGARKVQWGEMDFAPQV